MISALILSSLFASHGDGYLVQWEGKNGTTQVALEDGQAFKRVRKISKRHLRSVFTLRASTASEGRIRIDADLYEGEAPVHVTVLTKLDKPATLKLDGDTVQVRVKQLPEAMADATYSNVPDLVSP